MWATPLMHILDTSHNNNYTSKWQWVVFIKTSVAYAVGPSVTTSSTDFSSQNLLFWNLFEFSAAEIT
jgi:hypothetical protein